jgi:hypothetical protein
MLPFVRTATPDWIFHPTFSQASGGSRNIRQSGSLSLSVSGYLDYAYFFRRGDGLGGAYVAFNIGLYTYPDPSLWTWLNRDFANATDMAMSSYNAYYAAGGSAFALRPAYLQNPASAANRIDLPAPASVLSLGFRPSGNGGTLSMGTANGVWQVAVDETSGVTITSGPDPVTGTEGDSIERIAISSSKANQEAYLSRYYLYIQYYGYGFYKIPFFAVAPGRITGMAWSSDGTLYLAGTEGLAALFVGAC